jgi:hypothetical protein
MEPGEGAQQSGQLAASEFITKTRNLESAKKRLYSVEDFY